MFLGIGLHIAGSSTSLEAVIRSLFANGEQGGWYDPSDFSTMFQEGAATTPAAVGQPVGLRVDKSGRGNNASQATAPSRMTLQQDATGVYVQLDGVDDGDATSAIDLTATDKVTLCVGIRKTSDASTGTVAEFSADSSLNVGSFGVFGPRTGSGANYGARSGGTLLPAGVTSAASFAQPDSAVLTLQADIANDICTLRRNGAVIGTSALDQGAGNFGNFILYTGRRGGTTLPFAGRIYQQILVGRALTAAELTNVERYVGAKMGIAL